MLFRRFTKKYLAYTAVYLSLSGYSEAGMASISSFSEFKERITELISNKIRGNRAKVSYNHHPIDGIKINIETKNFVLRTFENRDVSFLKSIYMNAEIAKTLMSDGKTWSEEDFNRELREGNKEKKVSPFTVYVMEDKQKKKPIGVFELFPWQNTLQVSYAIDPKFQGQGKGSSLMEIVRKELIPILKKKGELKNIKSLIGCALETNNSSLKLLSKGGFKPLMISGNYNFPANWKLFEFSL